MIEEIPRIPGNPATFSHIWESLFCDPIELFLQDQGSNWKALVLGAWFSPGVCGDLPAEYLHIVTRNCISCSGSLQSLDWNGGMEWWNGMVEWNGGMEWWNGMVEWNSGMCSTG